MARSLKKGPFADASLLKKVDAMNASDLVSPFHHFPADGFTYNRSTRWKKTCSGICY